MPVFSFKPDSKKRGPQNIEACEWVKKHVHGETKVPKLSCYLSEMSRTFTWHARCTSRSPQGTPAPPWLVSCNGPATAIWVWVMESGRKVDPIVFILHAQSSKIMKVNADQLGAALFDQESDSVLLLN